MSRSSAAQISENKTPMNEVRLKLPGKISIPLVEFTDLPMSLQISEALLFHPAFTTKEEVAKGSFHVKFSTDEGIQVEVNADQLPPPYLYRVWFVFRPPHETHTGSAPQASLFD